MKITVPWAIPDQEIQQLKDVAQKQLELQEEAAQRRAAARRGRRAQSTLDSPSVSGPKLDAGSGAGTAQASSSPSRKNGSTGVSSSSRLGTPSGDGSKGQGDGETKKATRRRKLELRKGVPVKIVKGPYMNLKGTLLSLNKESKQVHRTYALYCSVLYVTVLCIAGMYCVKGPS